MNFFIYMFKYLIKPERPSLNAVNHVLGLKDFLCSSLRNYPKFWSKRFIVQQGRLTFGRVAIYDSGISMSARMLLLMAMAALCIWLAQSRLCRKCFLDFSERPPLGTHGTGNHHFSSFLWTWITLRNDPERVELDDMLPFSAYQNSESWKPSSIS